MSKNSIPEHYNIMAEAVDKVEVTKTETGEVKVSFVFKENQSEEELKAIKKVVLDMANNYK